MVLCNHGEFSTASDPFIPVFQLEQVVEEGRLCTKAFLVLVRLRGEDSRVLETDLVRCTRLSSFVVKVRFVVPDQNTAAISTTLRLLFLACKVFGEGKTLVLFRND